MKPEKKSSSSKKPAGTKKTPSPKAAVKSKETPPEPEKVSKPRRAVKKIAEKAVEAAEAAVKVTKRAAKTVQGVAEKAEKTVKKMAEATAAAAVTSPASKAKTTKRKPLAIPAILLEGDQPSAPRPSGPGQRYALGPTPPVEHFAEMEELPESYGTKRLILTARDPHWLYAHWDFTRDQLNKYNLISADGHLVLRVYENEIRGNARTQIHVHPESRNWFVHVGQGGTKYVAELGYYDRAGQWTQLAASRPTLTPPDALSEDTSVRFATIPVDVPFEQLIRIIKAAVSANVPLAEAIQQLRGAGFEKLPEPSAWETARWTPEQQKQLTAMITMDEVRRVWIGSLEITELVRRHLEQEISSIAAAQLQAPSSMALGSLASPFGGGMERQKGFWFNVNAELIIYGATEPDAKVEIGGRQIKLRPDGTFSYRFILPDGTYNLPAQATSADGDDTRCADLKFQRRTDYTGDVGAHPQDPAMKPPRVEHVA